MRIQLPDVNVLIALHNPIHAHHELAHAWFETIGKNWWATCPLTENGFVRVFAQAYAQNSTSSVSSAISLLKNMLNEHNSTHQFWPDGVTLHDDSIFNTSAILGPKQITDVYLLGLCQKYDGTFVTLDTGITLASIVSPHPDLLCIL